MNATDRVALVGFDASRVDDLVAMRRASIKAGVGVVDPHPIADHLARNHGARAF